ncbi:SNF2 family N-terminal domain-containing protein [Scheffersomyces coipomensis]|uniref:SNF2 family N-terminal domain-containing protein n=1 Tax=Scheffersomyces coipomensis TaxID=1788519 RepID=UPI00315D2E1C
MTPSVMEVINIEETESESEIHLKELIQEQETIKHVKHQNGSQNDDEVDEFNHLSKDRKLDRLNNLISKSQLYSQIIADNILQSSLLKRQQKEQEQEQEQEQPQQQPTPEETPTKRRRGNPRSKKPKGKVQHDITSMLSTKISDSTKSAKQAIEESQDNSTTSTIQQPKLISGATLKNYQLDGLEWLITLYENGLNGILADEMGLGKTLQCISFLSFLIENDIKGPFLIVVPLSTLTNWENEFKKFAPKLKIFKYSGSKQVRNKINLNYEINQKHLNIILTSYEISIKDFNKLNYINWNYLIVDEGHRLKNNNCVLIKFLKKLNTSNRLLLTGTPLQNNLNELWSLLNFILPDIFHDLELFQQWFNFDELTNLANDIGDDDDNENDDETKRLIKLNIQQSLIKNLHTILKPFLLRRLKRDVIKDLPPKKEYIIHIPLSKLQTKLYYDCINNRLYYSLVEIYLKDFIHYNHYELFKQDFDIIDQFLNDKFGESTKIDKSKKLIRNYQEFESDDEFEDFSNDPTDDEKENETYETIVSSRKRISKNQKQQLLLNTLFQKITKEVRNLSLQNLTMQLRNICNSPYIYYEPFLINNESVHESKFIEILLKNSSKFQVLDQLIESLLKKNHKVLIFSQFTKALDLIQDWLNLKHIEICRLDGSTSQDNRDEEIKKFNNSKLNHKVFLLSTRAGGLGINLVAADSVILFDNDWNPQMDLQAIDRVHRIGQTKPVKIFRFLVQNSIEEILITKSSSKRFLEKLVINLGQFKFNKLKSLIDTGAGNNENISVKDLLEFSKMNFKSDETIDEDEDHQFQYDFSSTIENNKLLNQDEMNELLDRSINCYRSIDDSNFKHISIFETVNNMDKED